jgi:hypothetical protein
VERFKRGGKVLAAESSLKPQETTSVGGAAESSLKPQATTSVGGAAESSLKPQATTSVNVDEEVIQRIWDNRRHVIDEVTY